MCFNRRLCKGWKSNPTEAKDFSRLWPSLPYHSSESSRERPRKLRIGIDKPGHVKFGKSAISLSLFSLSLFSFGPRSWASLTSIQKSLRCLIPSNFGWSLQFHGSFDSENWWVIMPIYLSFLLRTPHIDRIFRHQLARKVPKYFSLAKPDIFSSTLHTSPIQTLSIYSGCSSGMARQPQPPQPCGVKSSSEELQTKRPRTVRV